MSLSAQYKYALLKELTAGTHLVMISEVSLVKDENGQVIRSEDKGVRIKVQFIAMTPEIKRFEQRFWAKSSLMLKMCEAFKIDALAQRFDLEALNKRGYVAIKEVRENYGSEYYIIAFFPWEESLKVPTMDESLLFENKKTTNWISAEEIGNHWFTQIYKDDPTNGTGELPSSINPKVRGLRIMGTNGNNEQIKKATDDEIPIALIPIPSEKPFSDNYATQNLSQEEISKKFISLSQKLKSKPKKDGPINWTDL